MKDIMLKPFGSFFSRSSFDKTLDDFFNIPLFLEKETFGKNIKADITETNKFFIFKLDAPGVKNDDVNVTIENSILNINLERKDEHEEKTSKRHCKDVYYGSYNRRWELPNNINVKDVKAKLEDGVLNITIPKKDVDDIDNKRKIKIE